MGRLKLCEHVFEEHPGWPPGLACACGVWIPEQPYALAPLGRRDPLAALTADLIQDICDLITQGCSPVPAAAACDISPNQFRAWLRSDTPRGEQLRNAVEMAVEEAISEAEQAIRRIDSKHWLKHRPDTLETSFGANWRDKPKQVKHEHMHGHVHVQGGSEMDLSKLSKDELKQLKAMAVKARHDEPEPEPEVIPGYIDV